MVENNIEIVKRQLWAIADSLRSHLDSYKITEVILLFILIRRMEGIFSPVHAKVQKVYNELKDELDHNDMDIRIREVIGGLKFYTTSEDTMKSLLEKGYLDSVAGFEHYFRTFNKESITALEEFGAYSILTELAYKSVLTYAAQCFCDIDLGTSVDDNEFKELINGQLRKIEEYSRNGEHYTTYDFSRLMFSLATNGKNIEQPVTIYDPACGSAKLLRDATIFARSAEIYGQELMSSHVGLANLIANGMQELNQHIVSGDTLLEDKFEDMSFDFIISELPVNMPWREDIAWMSRGRFNALPPKDDSTLLFVQHIVNKMKANGRAVFTCLPKVFMASDRGSDAIRFWLLEEDVLDAILIMPGGVVKNLAIPYCICILDKNKPEDRKGKVQIIDCNKVFTRKQGGQVILDGLALQSLWESYASKDSLMDKDAFIGYQLDVNQPLRNEDGSIKLKNGEKVADKKKTLTVNIPSTEKDIIGYVRNNYLNHADPDAWVNVSTLQRYCSIDLQKLTAKETETISLANIEADANKMKRQMEQLLEDIFDNDEICGMASEPMHHMKKASMLNALVNVVRQTNRIKKAVMLTEGEYPVLSVDFLRDADDTDNLLFPENPRDFTLVEDSDTLIIMSGANAGEILRGKKGCLAGTLAKFECISSSIRPDYLYFLLKTKEPEIRNMAKGVTLKSINLKDLSSISVQIPSLEEQQKVVATLSAKIASIDQLMPMLGGKAKKTMQDYRQALIMDAVLGKKS